ncbi:MAG: AAA family ATPase [Deltaproteobacteria bacterium]|nr:AAA family ATPase [Candidatus Zymogenaceae bacterium]
MRIAVAGKGGTGKTTLSALVIGALKQRGILPILAVDADPNDNLGPALGMEVMRTLGEIREDFIDRRPDIPAGMTKGALLEMRMHQSVIEGQGVDLLVMGRPEGPGCYCFVNNLLRKSIEELSRNYRAVVIDNEAGMEHLSRKTVGAVDRLLLVSDHTVKGIRTALRLRKLADNMDVTVKETRLVVNRVGADGLSDAVRWEIEEGGLGPCFILPEDEGIARACREDTPLIGLLETPYGRAVRKLVDTMVTQD